jgi:hypothetical protein
MLPEPGSEREVPYQYDPEDDYGPRFDEGHEDPDGTWGDEDGE